MPQVTLKFKKVQAYLVKWNRENTNPGQRWEPERRWITADSFKDALFIAEAMFPATYYSVSSLTHLFEATVVDTDLNEK